jgi:parallel beta-helix repeat protein
LQAGGSIDKCTIANNQGSNVLIEGNSTPSVSKNPILFSVLFWSHSGTEPPARRREIRNGANNPLTYVLLLLIQIKDSTLTGARESGVLLLKGAISSLSRNTITGNRPCGIAISDSADPKVFSNQVG